MFPWWVSKRPLRTGEKRAEMYRRDLEERAALLQRLGFTAKRCKQRLAANVAWDFELHARPKHAAEVDRIVDGVYKRGGLASGPPTV